MNVSDVFVRRPIATTLLMAGILIFGLVGYELLPVAALPNVQFPTIEVTAQLPGASPQIMADRSPRRSRTNSRPYRACRR